MPRGFSEAERKLIRGRLLQEGRKCLERYGLKKTTVEELARGAAISKGAFYLFYDSKEELFLDIFQQFEAEYHSKLLEKVASLEGAGTERLAAFLKRALSLWQTHPLFHRFSQEEYAYLIRALPEEKLQQGIQDDEAFAARLLAHWSENGVRIDTEPRMVAALMRALFFINLHRDDFAPDIYPGMMDWLIEMVAQRLVAE